MESEALAADLAARALGAGPLYELDIFLRREVNRFLGTQATGQNLLALQASLISVSRAWLNKNMWPDEGVTSHVTTPDVFLSVPYRGSRLEFRFTLGGR